MPDEMENIDRYVSGQMTVGERQEFERRITSEPELAEEVAFHLSALAAAREAAGEERKARFRTIHEEEKNRNGEGIVEQAPVFAMPWLRRAVAAAAIVLVVSLAWVFFLRPASPKVLAQEYIRKELTRVGVTMGKDQDALTQARTLYNAGDLAGAASFLDSLLQKEPDDAEANKFSGIVSLRQGNHDKALGRFSRLAALPGLYANPGLFLEAVTLMDRDGVGDKAKAKEVLEQVVRDGLGGHEQSRDWLKKF